MKQQWKWDLIVWSVVRPRTRAAAYLGIPFEELDQVGRLAAVEAERSWDPAGGRSLSSWVYLQVGFALGKYLRQMGRRMTDDDEPGEDQESDLEAAVLVRSALDYLQARLQPGEWNLLWMRHVEGRDIAEIAEHCGIQQGAAKVRLHRAKTQAVTILEAAGIDRGNG